MPLFTEHAVSVTKTAVTATGGGHESVRVGHQGPLSISKLARLPSTVPFGLVPLPSRPRQFKLRSKTFTESRSPESAVALSHFFNNSVTLNRYCSSISVASRVASVAAFRFLGVLACTSSSCSAVCHSYRSNSRAMGSNGCCNGEIESGKQSYVNEIWDHSTEIFEYTSSANPDMIPIPIHKLDAKEHTTGPSRVTALDISKAIGIEDYPATSPNLLASFVRICVGEFVTTNACATSQAFYVIHGRGKSQNGLGVVEWSTGDLFVFPSSSEETPCTHFCVDDEDGGTGGAGLYWVSDSPLLSYLGVVPKVQKFKPAYFSRQVLLDNVENVRHEPGAKHRNRLGILLGNKETPETKTLTHVLWSLLNVLPAGEVQRPHRHNSVALDLAVYAAPGAYTLMGKELDSHGWVKDPVRVDWTTGSIFITPPGWWHSHHNDSEEEAWVLPIQDAGLYTHQRTLDIRFSDDEFASADKKATSQMRPRQECIASKGI